MVLSTGGPRGTAPFPQLLCTSHSAGMPSAPSPHTLQLHQLPPHTCFLPPTTFVLCICDFHSHCTHLLVRDWSFTLHTTVLATGLSHSTRLHTCSHTAINSTSPTPTTPSLLHYFHITHLYQFSLGHSNAFNQFYEKSNGAQPWTTAEPSAVHPVNSIQCKIQWRSAMDGSGSLCCAPIQFKAISNGDLPWKTAEPSAVHPAIQMALCGLAQSPCGLLCKPHHRGRQLHGVYAMLQRESPRLMFCF